MEPAVNPQTDELMERISRLTGRRHVVLTGSGTAALTIALEELLDTGAYVVLPDIVCRNVLDSVLYAGMAPLFCDVNATDWTLDIEHLRRLLTAYDVGAVIAVHLYGHAAQMSAIENLCRATGTALIDDAAQSLGAMADGKAAGAWGQIGIISFGYSKIVDAGSGGAILTDDADVADRLQRLASRDLRPMTDGTLAERHRIASYDALALAPGTQAYHDAWTKVTEDFRPLHFKPFDASVLPRLLASLKDLDSAIAHRKELAEIYRSELQDLPIVLPKCRPGSVPWRFTVLVDASHRERITAGLRDSGFDASNWYPALHQMYGPKHRQRLLPERSVDIAAKVLNLWVDPKTSQERAQDTARSLRGALEGQPEP